MRIARVPVFLAALLSLLPAAVSAAGISTLRPGDEIGHAGSATLFAPARLHASVRIAPADGRILYIVGAHSTVWLRVTVVDGARRRTLAAAPDLPAHLFGVRLPDDAARAARIDVDAAVVRGDGRPRLIDAAMLAQWIADGWSGIALCGLLGGLAVVFAALAFAQRSAASAWYAVLLAADAAITLPWLGLWHDPPAVGQPLHAALTAVTMIGSVALTLAFLGRDRLPAWVPPLLWSVAALQIIDAAGADLLTDAWGTPLRGWLDAAAVLTQALAGVLAWRRHAPGAGYFVAAMCAQATSSFVPYAAVVAVPDVVVYASQALLLAFAFAVAQRVRERDRLHLERLAHLDGLTGLVNRRALEAALRVAWDRAARSGAPLALLMIDVDHFKRYNDAYGHPAGDDALRRIARAIGAAAARHDDVVARYGGEEFVVALPATDVPGALQAAERIRAAIDALAIPHVEPPGYVTVSVGVAVETQPAAATVSGLLTRADAGLYVAKTEGRDRVALEAVAVPRSATL